MYRSSPSGLRTCSHGLDLECTTPNFRPVLQEMPKRILINAKWKINPAPTGVQRYAHALTDAMRNAGIDFDLAIPPSMSRWRATLWEQRALPMMAQRYDALLCPANMAPINLHESVRLLLTVHCLRFHFHPRSYPPSFVRWYKFCIPRLVERADLIFTVSQTQRAELELIFPEAVGKVCVMSPGVDSSFHPHHDRDHEAPSDQYIVYIGSGAPAKNLATLLNAYRLLNEAPKLVLIGVDPAQADLICPSELRGCLVPLGHIQSRERISALLAHAQALASPSLYESFGLPCLEAMASGCPVIASDLAAHREVCKSAARYVDPSDPMAWASAIEMVLGDDHLRAHMRECGLTRSKKFLWANAISTLQHAIAEPDAGPGNDPVKVLA